MNSLGRLCSEMGKLTEAEKLRQPEPHYREARAIALAERAFGPEHPVLGRFS